MDAKTAYKYGFLTRCAEEGLGPDQTAARVKAAAAMAKSAFLGEALKGLAFPIGLAGAAGIGVGALGGTLAAGGTPSAEDAEREIKDEELISAYEFYADQLARQRAQAARRRALPRPSWSV